ncbi:hypothetical protein PC116_g19505 [Phytophthora cactorum]|uniref:Uncharacterized protein n=1 Tax=Phytophthora cactorum TaxID=29920 RepID=A0A8T1C6P1_9STRA|nr:hypothetical protein PC114_g18294 [Phytophthora cactorum]KAG2916174.1 hypothetical protein PC117_g17811 [Phytophthora cactorum]KAG2997582.1 hypothetical protein PC119_g17645 [Phytophthora cactorum]KAG3024278.1 hypothetical protein PC120_g7128 [Phytophthora cactorum]KAG3145324.1 hypothetical protein C6341_g18423 [Phytophthora cactorum]
MMVHQAVWDFAEKKGTKQARAYSAMRKMLTGKRKQRAAVGGCADEAACVCARAGLSLQNLGRKS